MKSLESIYESILLENQNTNNIDLELLKKCVKGTYTINDDGSIDVEGSVNLSRKKLTKIPFNFGKVSGNFKCASNHLTSLEGAPNNVGGDFYCHYNQLTSLEGAPNNVGGSFYGSINPLTTLDYTPTKINEDFHCYDTKLKYSELFKIVDIVRGSIYYSSFAVPEDKDQIRIDRDVKETLKDNELGSLDI